MLTAELLYDLSYQGGDRYGTNELYTFNIDISVGIDINRPFNRTRDYYWSGCHVNAMYSSEPRPGAKALTFPD